MTKFRSFIMLAEMRTGSNFLESNLNDLAGVRCLGELFNPAFIGHPKTDDVLGMTLDAREADPLALLTKVQDQEELCGFRYFHNHDQRVLQPCLQDKHCAKIILTRNPVDSFVSWKTAQATGQWKLTNATHAKSHQITFDPEEFTVHLEQLQAFQTRVLRVLQTTGQTAFYITYDDLRDIDVINGLAAFLGVNARLSNLNRKLKKQNPEPLEDRVANFTQMQEALGQLDRFDLSRTPHFEPRRGPAIRTYIAAAQAPLVYMPLQSGPEAAVSQWLANLDQVDVSALQNKFTQKTLRQWQRNTPGHRSFTVLRHPLARAHAAFCDRILQDGPGSFREIRANLRRVHKLPIPEQRPNLQKSSGYDVAAHRMAFLAFLTFLRNNLSGQTAIRVDPAWAGQLTCLQGMAEFMLPDVILRENMLAAGLSDLANDVGLQDAPDIIDAVHPHEGWLAAIYDAELERAAREAYQRDYDVFGFEAWG
ncbi:sulfotransferase family 2 domain-containing protein [Yoonia sp. BS5-3]|uniref:Sulfotransferase family 2 domain-containing protein n=1 Tax=Yoonia phaeophyticola TaxID=3137369 RepID=A0ABZ2V5X2_9RHOB